MIEKAAISGFFVALKAVMSVIMPSSVKQTMLVIVGNDSLASASDEIKLAVDLIYLFENNEIKVETALAALKIVEADLLRKLDESSE
ncbi:DUF2496 domain-containing protein [Shewanella waksmanii]|uniref:DUF2496 domain-containing protein n=1 Tax=Shewanella waksmanii TaxID=213783 RepID=UPI0037366386